jgi:hypothetical protein
VPVVVVAVRYREGGDTMNARLIDYVFAALVMVIVLGALVALVIMTW